MEKHLKYSTLKIISLIILSLVFNNIFAQNATGEVIPYRLRDNITLRGDMTVTGNSILGVRGVLNDIEYEPNEPFDGQNNNGVFNTTSSFRRETIFNNRGQVISETETEINRPISLYNRAYIDIDDDPNFSNNFSNNFKANRANFEYGGTLNNDGNGSPTSLSDEGTFSSSGAELIINPDCGIVRRAYLYWSGVYPSETINTFNNGDTDIVFEEFTRISPFRVRRIQDVEREANPGSSDNDRNQLCGSNCEDYTEIKILPPGADQYYNISIDPTNAPSNPDGLELQSEVILDGLNNSFFNNQAEIIEENRRIREREVQLGRELTAAEQQQIRNDVRSFDLPNITDRPYVCVADVTELFNQLQNSGQPVSGFWTVGNVKATTGYREGSGLAGGWTLAVAYEENLPTATEREISFFDGYAQIRAGNPPIEFDSPPFNTIPDGPVNAWLATASLEGDRNFLNDQFSIETQTTRNRLGNGAPVGQIPDAAVPLRENSLPDNTTNFFNSTITNLTGRTDFRVPNSTNTLGYDTDHFQLANTANEILDNNESQATFWLSTRGDTYANFFTGFAVEIIAPNVQITKTAFDRFGTELTNTSEIEFGEQLTYELEIRNIGNDVAVDIELEDFLPANTVFVPGTTEIVSTDFNVNPTIDFNATSTDRNTLLQFNTTLITLPIPNLTPQGECQSGDNNCRDRVIVRIRNVMVVEECDQRNACIDRIENVALTSFRGVINPRPINQRDSFFRFMDGCDNLEQGPTVTLTNRVGECESQAAVICEDEIDLTAATGFNTYEWFRIDNPTDQNGNGIIDDADYAIDTNNDDRISRAELEAQGAIFVTETSGQVASPTSPGPNQLTVTIDDLTDTPNPNDSPRAKEPALYIVLQEAPNPCLQGLESFNVTVFDPLDGANNPLKDGSGNPILNGTVITPQCSIRNDLEITQFIVCSDGTPGSDSLVIPIPSGYPSNANAGGLDTNIVVSRYDEGSCTRDENSCPFISTPEFGSCNYTDVITTTASASNDFTITETGSYRFVATIPGGCTITVYFNAVILRNDLSLEVPNIGVCADGATVNVEGLPTLMDMPNRANTTELLYELEFFESTGTGFDENTATPVLIQNPLANSGSSSFTNSSEYGTFTVNRTAATGQQIIEVIVRATPIITGSVGDTAQAPLNCPELLRETVTFLDIDIEEFRFLRTPSCGFDDPITSQDDTTGDIIVTATAGSPQYIFQLINRDTNTIQITRGPTTNNSEVFNEVPAGVPFDVRVFANGIGSVPVNQPLPAGDNCVVESTQPIEADPIPNIVSTIEIVKALTCEPAQLRVTLSVQPNDPNFDFSNTNFEIVELNTLGGRASGRLTHFLIDDASNQPAPGDENIAANGAIIYADLNSIPQFTVRITDQPSCVSDASIPNSLTPFEGLKIEEDSITNVRCNGEENGNFTVQAFENNPNNNPYISPLADANTPTELIYEVVTATPNNTSITIDPNLLDRQTSPIFSGLPAGEYLVRAIDITGIQTPLAAGDPCLEAENTRPNTDSDNNGLTDCEESSGIDDSRTPTVAFPLIGECPSEEITITITEPDPVLPPTISLVQPYICGAPIQEAIIGVTDPSGNFGGTPPYTFTLIDDNNTEGDAQTADDRVISTTTSTNYSNFENITQGSYVVQITDANNCTSVFSDDIDIDPLPSVTFDPITIPVLNCNLGSIVDTADIQINATTTNGGVIEGYRIFSVDGVEVTNPAPFASNTTGLFQNLQADVEYVFETRTTNTLCVERTLPVEIEPIIPINLTAAGQTNVLCRGESTGEVSYNVTFSNVGGTTGYTYELTLPTQATPVREITTASNNGTINITGLAASPDDYTLTVTDASTGCEDTSIFRITEPATISSVTASTPVYNCDTDEWEFTVTPAGGTPGVYEYSLDNFATAANIQTSNSFSIPEPTTSTTLTIAVRDDNDCVGTPETVILDPVTDLSAAQNSATDVCLPNPNIIFDVTGTPPFRYRFKLDTDPNFPATFVSNITPNAAGEITVTNPPTTSGIYEFQIQDSLHELDACAVIVPITINEIITISNLDRAPALDCRPSGNIPATGEFVTFDVTGGDGNYNYTLTNITNPGNTPPQTNVGSLASPQFDFDSGFDEETIEISITDGNACTLIPPLQFTPNYPEAPGTPTATAIDILCNGDDSVITVIPAEGELQVNNFEYSFDNGNSFGIAGDNTSVINLGASTSINVEIVVRNTLTGCTSPMISLPITQPTPIVEVGPQTITNVTCDANLPAPGNTTPGSFQTTISGGTVPGTQRSDYLYELFDDSAPRTVVASDSNTTGTIDFQGLADGSYFIRVTDGNNCIIDNPIRFNIVDEPEIAITDIDTEGDCTNGVTLFFQVQGGVDPSQFRIAAFRNETPVSPDTLGDNLARLGNADFLAIPAGIDNLNSAVPANRTFRITNLDFQTPISITLVDDSSGCRISVPFTTPSVGPPFPSPVEITSVVPIDSGDCNPTSGAVDITFDVTPSSQGGDFEVDIFRNFENIPLVPTVLVTNALATNVVPRISGLPEGQLRVRVIQVAGAGGFCSSSATFNIDRAPVLEGPFEVSNVPASCDDPNTTINEDLANFSVRVRGGQGPFEYRIESVDNSNAIPDATSTFPLSDTFAIDPADPIITPGIVPPNTIGQVEVWVRDVNGCISGPLLLDVQQILLPQLTLADFSPDECNDTNSFNITATINNFDSNQTYMVTLNGGVPQSLPLTATSNPNEAEGIITVDRRIPYTVEVFGSTVTRCTTQDSFTIFPRLTVDVTLGDPDCDANIATITATIADGFAGEPGRQLTYELRDGNNTLLDTISGSTNTTETFNSGVNGVNLVADTDYTITVIDDIDGTGVRTCENSDTALQPALQLPALGTPTVVNLTCPTDTNGEITINTNPSIIGNTAPTVFELYEFADTTAAQNAIDTGTVTTAGTLIASATGDNRFTGLQGETLAVYVPVLISSPLNCSEFGAPIAITAPNEIDASNFNVSVTRQGVCNDIDTNNDTAIIRIEPLTPFANGANSDYVYSIAGIVTDASLTGPVDQEITPDTDNSQVVNIEIRDRFNTCGPIVIPVTIDPCPIPVAPTVNVISSFSCVNEETIQVEVTNAVLGTDYTLTINAQPTGSNPVIAVPTQTATASGIVTFDVALDVAGSYAFSITDTSNPPGVVNFVHNVQDVDQLLLRRIPVAELNCQDDTTMIGFEVIDYTGFFQYTITDQSSTTVVEQAVVETATGTVTHTTGMGATATFDIGSVTTTVTSGTALGVNTFTINVEAVSDAAGSMPISPTRALCQATTTISINGPLVPVTLDPLMATTLTCTPGLGVTITSIASGGTPPYTYTLTGPGVPLAGIINTTGVFENQAINISAPSTYTVSVVDANGCPVGAAVSESTLVNPTEQLPDFELNSNPVACAGDDASITVALLNNIETVQSDTSLATAAERIASRSYALVEVDSAGNNPSAPLATVSHSNNIEFLNVRPGINGEARFFRVNVIDNFGCTTTSDVIRIEAPVELAATNMQTIAIDCETSRPEQGGLETAQYEISILGGTPPYTFTRSASTFIGGATPALVTGGEVGAPNVVNGTPNSGMQLYELRPGRHFFRITDSNGCEAFTQVNVGPAPSPIVFDLSISNDTLCPTVLGFVDIDGPVLGGSGGPVFELWVTDGNNEVQINDGTPIASVNHTAGSSLFTGLPDVRITPPATISPATAQYEYRVSTGTGSAACPVVSQPFSISQFPSLEFNGSSTNVSCEFEEDATITVDLTDGLILGEYTLLLVKEGDVDRSSPNFANGATSFTVPLAANSPTPINPIEGTIDQSQGVALSLEITNLSSTNNSVTFENLGEGDYTLIVSTPTGCIPTESFITISRNEPLTAVFQDLGTEPNCESDAPGTRTYTLEGGTPPYYYAVINIDNLEEQPNVEDIFGIASNRVDVTTPGIPVDVTITGPNPGEPFENNVNYQIFFIDSGNGSIAPMGSTANIIPQEDFNSCEIQTLPFIFEVPDLTGFTTTERYICETGLYDVTVNLATGSNLVRDNVTYTIFNTVTGVIETSRGDNTLIGIAPGEIITTIEYERPDNGVICSSSGPDGSVMQTLVDFSGLSFVRQEVLDENGSPILDANGNNTGLPFELVGLNEYRISADGGLPPYTYEVSNGQNQLDIETDLRGRAVFTVTETGVYTFTVRDANGCIAFSSANNISFIDIEIPNVFNPSSSNPEVNRWYPDNLTFGDVFPIPEDGIVVDEGITVITITTQGTTTGGVFTPGPNGTGTITGGTTTGGITTIITINPDGETSSTVSVNTGGTLNGGTTTGSVTFDPITNEPSITDGTTTGGTPTGGSTSSPVDTNITATPNSTTVIRTTVGSPSTDSSGETTGGVFIETTTAPGPNNTTITTARVIDLTTSGTVTGGTPTGNIVVGGSISGGTPIETNLPVETTTSDGFTINRRDNIINFENIEVMVFDRYGRLLEKFQGILDDNAGQGWDGTYQGKPMPTGDYWYLIKLNDNQGREISGNFTLYRSK